MAAFKTFLQENSLYKDQAEKDELLKKHPQWVKDLFWINTLGFLAIQKQEGTNSFVRKYWQTVNKVQLTNIDDVSNDTATIIKTAFQAHFIPQTFANEFTKLLYILKTRSIPVDDVKIRELFKKVPMGGCHPSSQIAAPINEFIDGKVELQALIYPFYLWARKNKYGDEFQNLSLRVFHSANAMQALAKTVTIHKDLEPDADTPTATPTIAPTATPAPVATTPPPQKTFDDELRNFPLRSISISGVEKMSVVLKMFAHWGADKAKAYIGSNYPGIFAPLLDNYISVSANPSFNDAALYSGAPYPDKLADLREKISLADYIALVRFMLLSTRFPSSIILKGALDIYNGSDSPTLSELDSLAKSASNADPQNVFRYNPNFKNWILATRNVKMEDLLTTPAILNLLFAANDDVKVLQASARQIAKLVLNKTYSLGGIGALSSYNNIWNALVLYVRGMSPGSPNTIGKLTDDDREFAKLLYNSGSALKSALPSLGDLIDLGILDKEAATQEAVLKTIDSVRQTWNMSLDQVYDALKKLVGPSLKGYIQKQGWDFKDPPLSTPVSQNLSSVLEIFARFGELNWALEQYAEIFNAGELYEIVQTASGMNNAKLSITKFVDWYSKEFPSKVKELAAYLLSKVKSFGYGRRETLLNALADMPVDLSDELAKVDSYDANYQYKDSEKFLRKYYDVLLPKLNRDLNRVKSFTADDYRKHLDAIKAYLKKWPDNHQIVVLPPIAPRSILDWLLNEYKTALEQVTLYSDSEAENIADTNIAFFGEIVKNAIDAGRPVSLPAILTSKLFSLGVLTRDQFKSMTQAKVAGLKDLVTEPDIFIDHMEKVINDPSIAGSKVETNINKTYTTEFYHALADDKNIPLAKKRQMLEKACDLLARGKPVRRTKTINTLFNTTVVRNSLNDVSQNSAIPILKQVTDKDIHEILKFNNFSMDIPNNIKYNKREPVFDWLERNKKYKPVIPAVKATPLKETNEEMERKTVEYTKYYNTKHGYTGALFLQSFDVNLPSQELDDWMKQHPDPRIIPAFHGTGSIAASMILRFGFKVVTQAVGGVTVTGKMLGDGIYFSNVISKSIQYLGDVGFNRTIGTVGYLLEMEAFLGVQNVNYKAAGLNDNGPIRSPEWCVFNPRAQLRIYKAHKVKLVSMDDINVLRAKYPDAVKEDRYFKRFKTFLKEEPLPDFNYNTFIFYDGRIPLPNGTLLPFDQFEEITATNPDIQVGYSQLGPEVVVRHTFTDIDPGFFHIPDSSELVIDNPNGIWDNWCRIINNKMPIIPNQDSTDVV